MANSGRRRPAGSQPERPVRQNQTAKRPVNQPVRRGTGQRRKKHGSALFLRLLTMFLIVAVFLFGIAIFFKVTEIQVQGNNLYTAEEVAAASGVELGDNLITLNKAMAAGKIRAVLPYVENVRISRVLPGTVVLEIQETDAAYLVSSDDGTSWLMNGSGKMLERASTSAADYPRLTGVTAQAPESGSQIVCEETENLAAAKLVMEQLENTDFISQIAEINVEKPYDIFVWYGTQYQIRLGSIDEMAYKIQYLTSVLDSLEEQVGSDQGGEIDLTFEEEKVARFKPW